MMRVTSAVVPLLAAAPFFSSAPVARRAVARAVINDNRVPAGALHAGVLTVRLEVREVDWHPDGEDAPGIVVRAFAEVGKPARVPGPLIRVRQGTTIRASITNSLAKALVIHGLATHRPETSGDTVVVSAGATLGFLVACLTAVWWIFRTGYKLKA